MNTQIARTILQQLGGPKIGAFIGTKTWIGGNNSLSFRFKGSKKYNMCKIQLNSLDTYDVTFYKFRGIDVIREDGINGIYCDQLVEIFERTTNLFLHF